MLDAISPIAVLGPYRGGTSLVTGILKELGCFTGNAFFDAQSGYCTYEDEWLRCCCLQCFDENTKRYRGTFEQRVANLRCWAEFARSETAANSFSTYVGKHPTMCMLINELEIAWQFDGEPPPLFVSVERPVEDTIRSWDKAKTPTGHPWWPRPDREAFVNSLIIHRDNSLAKCNAVNIDFQRLRSDSESEILKLAKACGLPQTLLPEASRLIK
ncbi:hypothetical protein LF1_41230 [Rubripirellula obstinata]|uniref:Sulfotransferase family protein n=1 Tax=Rubripirellula obstinata TaxID=406547 RepID=A0A5B1CQB3_9BACT|nr:hypothetical protein LF1_41230 [Rubripirellula obstinata]